MKTINDIRQCDIFDHSVLNFLQNLNPVNLDVSYRENLFCTVITQDCDIVHQKQEEEPFVEFIIGDLTQDKSCKNGKNPRKLHIENGEELFEFNIHNRFFVKKKLLTGFDFPDVLYRLTDDNKKILKKWLGNRYIRAAFPDNFNKRLFNTKINKFIEKSISAKVSHIFFEVEDRELQDNEIYKLNVMVVADTENNEEKEKIEDAYLNFFDGIEGIDNTLKVVTEDEVTLKDLRNYKRWDKDSISFSKQNQSFPVEAIDQV